MKNQQGRLKFTPYDKCCFCDNNFRRSDYVCSIPNGTTPETYSLCHQHCLSNQLRLARDIAKAGGYDKLIMKTELEKLLRRELFKYGFLPMLIVLERREEVQHFETCKTIIDVLKKHGEDYGYDIPTRYDGMAIAEYKLAFMTQFNLSGDIAVANSESYANEIELEINKLQERLKS